MRYIFKLCLVCSLLSLFIFSSCRYDDGPVISFRTVYSRLIPADWQIDQFTINGEDMTQLFIDSNNCNMYFATKTNVGFSGQCGYHYYGWYYHLIDFNNKMEFDMPEISSDFVLGPFGKYRKSVWDIHRLTNKELWIEANYEGSDYYIKMHKIKEY
jgi:hypothetical protein